MLWWHLMFRQVLKGKAVSRSNHLFIYRRRSSSSAHHTIFSGIQPTGVPHLGNYLGALQEWVRLQNEADHTTQLLFSIADLHAITVDQDASQLQKWKRETLAVLLAVGLDPDRSTIFYQSSVPAHTELMWILSCTAPVGYLTRMTQWKSKLAASDNSSTLVAGVKSNLRLGLFSYPVLQAADILLYRTTQVPVGQDQAQHVEFARECAARFNAAHGQVFKRPETIISPAKRIMSLKEPHLKMSKSHDEKSRINITDSPEIVSMKIRLALTDSTSGLTYDALARPGVSNMLSIVTHLSEHRSAIELAQRWHSLSLHEFKNKVANTISRHFSGMRAKYEDLMQRDDGMFLDRVASHGAKKAREQAEKTMFEVRSALGL